MTSHPSSPKPRLMIPGPIEFDDHVLAAMSHSSESHVDPAFVSVFGECLTMLRKLLQTSDPASQPFIVSGSGTLGWDMVASNLAEPGHSALVLTTGYFGNSFADCFKAYAVHPTQLTAAVGERPSLEQIEQALKEKSYDLITITHVDTSTGVLNDVRAISELVHRVSPNTLVVVDGVCSVGAEPIHFDEWKLDLVMTASQKAIGSPAGLSILMASGRAIDRFKARQSLPNSYFPSWKNWLPIMQNYEAKKPSYFATPSPQLIRALHITLSEITSHPLNDRFERHRIVSDKVKTRITQLGLTQLATDPNAQAHTMTAVYLPEGLTASEFLPKLYTRGVVLAGGLLKDIGQKYVRFGHMGVSVTDSTRDDVDLVLAAFTEILAEFVKNP